MDTDKLCANVREVQRRIRDSAVRAGRKAEEITLVAVTKTVSAEVVEALIDLGVNHIGENRVRDAGTKKRQCRGAGGVTWHMIGHLQRNKVKEALAIFDFFHSVDSVPLAQELNRRADPKSRVPVLLEVNVSGESSKQGFEPRSLERELEALTALDHLEIQGLMTMAPLAADMTVCREYFRGLWQVAKRLRAEHPVYHLSMGMSRDFEVAVEEGATMVRIGTAIFEDIDA